MNECWGDRLLIVDAIAPNSLQARSPSDSSEVRSPTTSLQVRSPPALDKCDRPQFPKERSPLTLQQRDRLQHSKNAIALNSLKPRSPTNSH
ncbi:MAG: hypothetical protein AAGD25_18195 [Cyanobacteria bacterium P01_F01_bin.150]